MSGEYPRLLAKRADAMLSLARELYERGLYDIAVLNAEFAAQLYAKALLYRVTGEEWRGHNIRQLLGALVLALREQKLFEEAEEVERFVRGFRRFLAELEEAHTRAVYGVYEYSGEQARMLIEVAERVIELLKRVEGRVFGGYGQ